MRSILAAMLLSTWPVLGIDYGHGISYLEPLKYAADFSHFAYANPDAPKGGMVRFPELGTFDSFNNILDKGRVPLGICFTGINNLIYDRLLESAIDETASFYGRLAEAVWVSDDYKQIAFKPLERVGIATTAVSPEVSNWLYRMRTGKFDGGADNYIPSNTPGLELRNRFSSAAADEEYGQNWTRIRNPAVDGMIDQVLAARNQRDFYAATRALDRILPWNFYYYPRHGTARLSIGVLGQVRSTVRPAAFATGGLVGYLVVG